MSDKEKKFILGNPDIDCSFVAIEMTWDGVFRDPRVRDWAGEDPPESFSQSTLKRVMNTYMAEDSLKSFAGVCSGRLFEDPELIGNLKQGTVDSARQIQSTMDKAVGKVADYTHEELAQKLEEAKRLQVECAAFGAIVAFADIFAAVTDRLIGIVKKRTGLSAPVSAYLNKMSEPPERSLTARAYADIRDGLASDEDLLRKYYWLDQGYIGRGLNRKELVAIQKSNSRENDGAATILVSELGLEPEEAGLAKLAQDMVFVKNLRADVRQCTHVFVNKVVDRLGEEWQVSARELETLSVNELAYIVRGEARLPDELGRRMDNGVYIPKGGLNDGYTVYVGKEAECFFRNNVKTAVKEEQQDIKGQIAQPGKVQGKVRLVFGPQHMGKVEEGDILVAPSTSPQVLPAMKKASAFVTDIGGITSHAAIVAREMKKPCIVGTQNATQILADGYEVEVDADAGVVKIIR